MRQYEAVIEAMEQLGGYAALGELYQKALAMPDVTSLKQDIVKMLAEAIR